MNLSLSKFDAIVIGVSAGGLQAMTTLLEELPADYPLPIIVVQHRSREHRTLLEEILQDKCRIAIRQANEKEMPKPGTVYFAPADYHLQIESDGRFSLSCDELVNYSRPSIDVLFETAAEKFKNRLLAIILTGASKDGTEGLKAVLAYGGTTVAQQPGSAQFSYMPQSAIDGNAIQYIMPIHEIRALLLSLA